MRMKSRFYNILCWWKIETDFLPTLFSCMQIKKRLTNRVRGIDSNPIYKLLLVWIGNTKLGITTSLTWDVAVRS